MAYRDHSDRSAPPHHPDGATGFLGILADSLCRALADNGGDVLVHVASSPRGPDVGVLALEGRPPADLLLGTVAPDDWIALGVATRGWTRPLDRRGDMVERSLPADIVVLVHRRGEVVGRLRLGDRVLDDQPAHGLTLDAIQRSLGLPTAAPLVPTGHHFASTWLDNIVRAGREQAHALTWSQVCALHPAAQLLAADEKSGPGELVTAAKALERACDWERLRWMVVEGQWQTHEVAPTEAAWFDAGSFSRRLLGSRRPVDLLLGEVTRVAGPRIARRCTAALHQLGIPGPGGGRVTAV